MILVAGFFAIDFFRSLVLAEGAFFAGLLVVVFFFRIFLAIKNRPLAGSMHLLTFGPLRLNYSWSVLKTAAGTLVETVLELIDPVVHFDMPVGIAVGELLHRNNPRLGLQAVD